MKYYKIIDSDEYKNPNDIICYAENCYESKYNIKHYDVNQGLFLKDYNDGITFYYDEKNGSKVTDYISNNLGWIIISPRFKTILEVVGVNNVQYIPIEIRGQSTNDVIMGYSIVNIINLVDGLSLESSVYKVRKVRSQEYISVIKPALDSIKLRGLHLVRVSIAYLRHTFRRY